MLNKIFLRIGFLSIFYVYTLGKLSLYLFGLDLDFESHFKENTLNFLLFIMGLTSTYFILYIIIDFWKSKYNFILKSIIIIISIFLYLIPFLFYYIY